MPLAAPTAGSLRPAEDHVGVRIDADLDGSDPQAVSIARAIEGGGAPYRSLAVSYLFASEFEKGT